MLNNNYGAFSQPLYSKNNMNWRTSQSTPQEVELMMKQKFNQNIMQNQIYQQEYQNDSYTEFQQTLMSCSPNIRQKIINDEEYQKCDRECETLIKQAVEEIIIPQLLGTAQGRIAFERICGTTKKLKEKYCQEEYETNQKLQMLMQDDVVKKRLEELGQQSPKKEQPKNLSREQIQQAIESTKHSNQEGSVC